MDGAVTILGSVRSAVTFPGASGVVFNAAEAFGGINRYKTGQI